MRNWLEGLILFALLIGGVLLVDWLLMGRHGGVSFEKWLKDFQWGSAVGYFLLALTLLFGLAFLSQFGEIERISGWLTLAEREMNGMLRGWGGGLGKDARLEMARDRARWADILPKESAKREELFDLLKTDFDGGPQGANMGKARMTAFLLRELYEGNIRIAQQKIYAETKIGGKPPFVAPGVRELVGFDKFDKDKGFPAGSGVGWWPLLMTVKFRGYPRDIIMVKPGPEGKKIKVTNWKVIQELTTPQA